MAYCFGPRSSAGLIGKQGNGAATPSVPFREELDAVEQRLAACEKACADSRDAFAKLQEKEATSDDRLGELQDEQATAADRLAKQSSDGESIVDSKRLLQDSGELVRAVVEQLRVELMEKCKNLTEQFGQQQQQFVELQHQMEQQIQFVEDLRSETQDSVLAQLQERVQRLEQESVQQVQQVDVSAASEEETGATVVLDVANSLESRVTALESFIEDNNRFQARSVLTASSQPNDAESDNGIDRAGSPAIAPSTPSGAVAQSPLRKGTSSRTVFTSPGGQRSGAQKVESSRQLGLSLDVTGTDTLKKTLRVIETRRTDACDKFSGVDKQEISIRIRQAIIEKVHQNKLSYLDRSVWEVVVVVGVRGVEPLESVVAFSLLVINVILQALICIILVTKFTKDDNQEARKWRYQEGHGEKFASSVGRPMVSRMCVQDTSLELSGAQQFVIEDVARWLNLFVGVPVGVILVVWCLSIWFLFIWKEVQSTVDRIQSLAALPRHRGTKIFPIENSFIMVSISGKRLIFAIAFCVLRILVAGTISGAGGLWLVNTESIEDLLLNAVALVFALEIDEVLFVTACPLTVRSLIEALEPMPCPLSGALHVPLRALGTLFATSLFLLGFCVFPLRQQWQKNEDLQADFCGDEKEFVTGINSATGMVFTYSPAGGSWPDTDSLVSRVTRNLVQGKPTDEHLPMSSWPQLLEYVYMPLGDASRRFGSCHDHGAATDGFMLAALRDALGAHNSNLACRDLTKAQCDSHDAIVRLACPVTCGCGQVRGPFNIYGCSMTHCAAIPQYELELRTLRAEDMHREVLRQLPMWEEYWKGYVSIMDSRAALNTIRWHPPFVRSTFMLYGCDAIYNFTNAQNASKGETFDFFCHSQSSGTRRPLSIFCPHACSCVQRTSTSQQLGQLTPEAWFCPNPPAITLIACAGATITGPVTVEKNMCNQSLSNLSSPDGHYLCQPFGYNGKHSYVYKDYTGVTWKIRWETASNFDWAALYMGAKAGYAGVSKWTLSSLNNSAPLWSGLDKIVARFFAVGNSTLDFLPESGWLPRNTSNTDVQCAGGQLTTKGGGEFGAGSLNDIYCPVDYRNISSNTTCQKASLSFGYAWYGEYQDDTYPSGCYGWSKSRVYWNPVTNGAKEPVSFVICERDVGR